MDYLDFEYKITPNIIWMLNIIGHVLIFGGGLGYFLYALFVDSEMVGTVIWAFLGAIPVLIVYRMLLEYLLVIFEINGKLKR